LAFHGELTIAGQEPCMRATLCRCGQSKNKPFCDGSHTAAGFQATGEPKMKESAALARRNGALKVLPLTNGPLKVQGALEIVSGTGHTINRVMETYLCRCGGSANKPYCDGTHAKIGFTTP
jgi:CDGSH-type Zn-finger protein